jgi:CheY-like chemotaxis protein
MQKNRVLITAEKDSFLIRVLVKKIQDSGMECEFVPWNINDINAKWEDTNLLAMYMIDGARPSESFLHFLADKLVDDDIITVPIGDKSDVDYVLNNLSKDSVFKSYFRPLDNAEFVKDISDLFLKVEKGEYRKTILVVDDDPNYLSLVREWLRGTYKVAMANSGLQAIKWLGKNKADLILLDYEMPITDGPQVLEMLRSDEDTKYIPVMFLTGKGDKESVMSVLSLKPQGYFLKTIDKIELLEKLKEFFILHKN